MYVILSLLLLDPVEIMDQHSFAKPHEVVVRHAHLNVTVDFTEKKIVGSVTLRIEQLRPDKSLILDTKKLTISQVEVGQDENNLRSGTFQLGNEVAILGQSLTIPLQRGDQYVKVTYSTSPEATALQWLSPALTSGKKYPALFTQSQAINARTWIPIQDTPGVRQTYSALVNVKGTDDAVIPVMSAAQHPTISAKMFRFEMKQPIPSYLIALAVGEFKFQSLGKRTGVWAEPIMLSKAAKEFEDLEAMLLAVEELYGPYRWERYDVLVLPPSFPFGGMENPRLTFATPTVLAGDKSLVSLLAHELAHSWSGNLVTNATWRDFWLNEGFTVYLERRILEKVYGKARAEMEGQIAREDLQRSIKTLKDKEQVLFIDLADMDPDDNVTDIPYEKGNLFLLHVEKQVGRERFDAFLKNWFATHSFESVTTPQFIAFMEKELIKGDKELVARLHIDEWVNKPGLPASMPRNTSPSLSKCEAAAKEWAAGKCKLSEIKFANWNTQERLHFLRSLPEGLRAEQFDELNTTFKLTSNGNSEIACLSLEIGIRAGSNRIDHDLEGFLVNVGRRKFLKPLYEELNKTSEGREKALTIYKKARPGYHPISVGSIDALLGWK